MVPTFVRKTGVLAGLLLCAMLIGVVSAGAAVLTNGTAADVKGLTHELNAVQIPFLEAKDQPGAEGVAYYARTFGGICYVTKEGHIIYALPEGRKPSDKKNDHGEEVVRSAILKERFPGAKITGVRGDEASPMKTSRFTGNDPAKWERNTSSYNTVVFGEIYEGIELKLKARANNIEKIFLVRPGADVKSISVEMSGAEALSINAKGELEVTTELGSVKFTAPVAYQEIGGRQVSVPVAYKIADNSKHTYAFAVGDYDREKPLVIDPLLASTFLGGKSTDLAYSMAADSMGNIFVTGYTLSTNFPTVVGSFCTTNNSNRVSSSTTDVFISKFNSTLSQLLASTYLGGTDYDYGYSITVDLNGNVYITGSTLSPDFPTTYGAYERSPGGDYDVFVSKLTNDLDELLGSTYLGGWNFEEGLAIAVDIAGNAYVTGNTWSDNYPTTPGAYMPAQPNITYTVFVSYLNSDLTALIGSSYLGGTAFEEGTAIAVNLAGEIIVGGNTWSPDFPTTAGSYDPTENGGWDIFVAKLNPALTALLASTFVGGSDDDVLAGLDLDVAGNVYFTGYTWSLDYPVTVGAYQTTFNGGNTDAYVSKLDYTLSTLDGSSYMGGKSDDYAAAIKVDAWANVFITGNTWSTNFPTTPFGFWTTYYGGITDIFISKFNNTLTTLSASTFMGGIGADYAQAITVDRDGDVFIAGYCYSTAYPTTTGAYDTSYNGKGDVIVSKLDNNISSMTLSVALAGSGSGTVTSNPSGIVCGTGGTLCSYQYKRNSKVTLSAKADTNSVFTGWSGSGCSGKANCVVTMSLVRTVNAKFQKDPTISPSPTTKNFGYVKVGNTLSNTFKISNQTTKGVTNLLIGTITVTGADYTSFYIINDYCSGLPVLPSGYCTVTVVFAPLAPLTTKNAKLNIPSNDPANPLRQLTLTGKATQ
jgi:hypothetical protein